MIKEFHSAQAEFLHGGIGPQASESCCLERDLVAIRHVEIQPAIIWMTDGIDGRQLWQFQRELCDAARYQVLVVVGYRRDDDRVYQVS